jgi:PBP1b-binding outer membrane lipoprotein LpoB
MKIKSKKILHYVIYLLVISSCSKEYKCVCFSVSKNEAVVVESVKTTKLGSKGFKETCIKNETQFPDYKDCRLE